MKIFLDTAETDVIRKHFESGLIDGVTTNPSLIMKSGRDPEEVYHEIKDIGVSDISMEVVGGFASMLDEGRRLYKKFGNCCTVKVPCTPDGLLACRLLSKDLIKVNVTLIFSSAQAILAAKSGATYVSPFVGRIDDNSFSGLDLIKEIDTVYSKCSTYDTKILSASIRDVGSVSKSFINGADIITIPPSIFEKMYSHVLTDKWLDQFNKDWEDTMNRYIKWNNIFVKK